MPIIAPADGELPDFAAWADSEAQPAAPVEQPAPVQPEAARPEPAEPSSRRKKSQSLLRRRQCRPPEPVSRPDQPAAEVAVEEPSAGQPSEAGPPVDEAPSGQAVREAEALIQPAAEPVPEPIVEGVEPDEDRQVQPGLPEPLDALEETPLVPPNRRRRDGPIRSNCRRADQPETGGGTQV